ncbi:MAG: DnaA regulatory inactivator Hda [Betaproteobacteria bacterium]|nr:DnaA regulatory inactivator Hda [Betaproteobacteria bacterium]
MLLDLRPEQSPSFENFVTGQNTELVARLARLPDPGVCDQIYVWGPPGSGRSHLLRATLAAAQARQRPTCLIEAATLGEHQAEIPNGLLIIDDVDALSAAGQITLFRTFNTARLIGLALLLSGPLPPLGLQAALREDLRTRIGSTMIYQVQALSDAEKAAALRQQGLNRGMNLDEHLIDYLLRHGRRDLPSLLGVLDALDRASLAQQRPLTLPLLREILQTSLELDDEPGTV